MSGQCSHKLDCVLLNQNHCHQAQLMNNKHITNHSSTFYKKISLPGIVIIWCSSDDVGVISC